jgi:hypothetical protein
MHSLQPRVSFSACSLGGSVFSSYTSRFCFSHPCLQGLSVYLTISIPSTRGYRKPCIVRFASYPRPEGSNKVCTFERCLDSSSGIFLINPFGVVFEPRRNLDVLHIIPTGIPVVSGAWNQRPGHEQHFLIMYLTFGWTHSI